MYKRLKLAKSLLSFSGIIICAIDDYEYHNLRHILDSIFGENNRLGTIVVIHNPGGRQDDKFIATAHEYMLIYAHNSNYAQIKHLNISEKKRQEYKLKDEYGRYKLRDFRRSGSNSRRVDRPKLWYPIYVDPNTLEVSTQAFFGAVEVLPIDPNGTERVWRWYPRTLMDKRKKYIEVKKINDNLALFVKEREEDNKGEKPKTIWDKAAYSAANGTNELKKIFGDAIGEKIFDYPKSPHLVRDILKITTKNDSTVLDFFAGSGTTGQAVLELNREDAGNRKFILVTNNETGPRALDDLRSKGCSQEEIQNTGVCKRVCYPRLKRVMTGYPFSGTDNVLLFEKRITLNILHHPELVLDEIEDLKEKRRQDFDEFTTHLEDGVLRCFGVRKMRGENKGLGGNLKYFELAFINNKSTDMDKKTLANNCTEILCLKDNCFDLVKSGQSFKIFKDNNGIYLGIVYDDDGIEVFKTEIKTIKERVNTYIFSLDESAKEEEFEDMPNSVTVLPIPEPILNTYKKTLS